MKSTGERQAYVSCREGVSPSLRVMENCLEWDFCHTLFSDSIKIRWHRGKSVLKRYIYVYGRIFLYSQEVSLMTESKRWQIQID